MRLAAQQSRQAHYLPHTVGVLRCPTCGGTVQAGAPRCSVCGFTGADSMKIFPSGPPELLPVSDLASILPASGLGKIEAAIKRLSYRYPQFRWCVMTAALPQDVSPSVFGFWLLNAAPLAELESPELRAWTVLLVIDAVSNQAAVIPGYAAEPYISDENWRIALSGMALSWAAGNPIKAIVRFFKKSQHEMGLARKHYSIKSATRRLK